MVKIFSMKGKEMDMENKRKRDIDAIEEAVKKSSKETSTIEFELGMNTMIFIVAILAVIFFGGELLQIFLFLFLGLVIMSATKPIVNWLEKRKIKKGFAIFLTYFLAVVIIVGLSSAVLIPFVEQSGDLLVSLKDGLTSLINEHKEFEIAGYTIELGEIGKFLTDSITSFTTSDNVKNVANVVTGAFGGLTFLLTAIIFSIYMIWDHDNFIDILLVRITSDAKKDRVKKLILDTEKRLGSWMLGQAAVSSIAGVILGSFLALLGIPFALPLGVLAALLDSIPNLGATVAAIPAILIALFTFGPVKALIVLVGYALYQQLENNIVVPKVMGGAVGFGPVVVLLGVLVFVILFGVWGALLALPVLLVGQAVYEFYIDLQKLKAKGIV
jgi:predicted PurR-regulated permease PerM